MTEAIGELAQILSSRGVDYYTGLNISLQVRRVTREMIAWLEDNPHASVAEMCRKSRELNRKSIEEELSFFDKYVGRQIHEIKAWGTDEYDFTPDVLGAGSFSVGEFGYVDLNFDGQHLYLSTDGMKNVVPIRPEAFELQVASSVTETLVGATLEQVKICAGGYAFYFHNLPVVSCTIWHNDGHCDRNYLEFDFLFEDE